MPHREMRAALKILKRDLLGFRAQHEAVVKMTAELEPQMQRVRYLAHAGEVTKEQLDIINAAWASHLSDLARLEAVIADADARLKAVQRGCE